MFYKETTRRFCVLLPKVNIVKWEKQAPLVSNLFFQGKWVFERQWRGHIRAQILRRGSGGY